MFETYPWLWTLVVNVLISLAFLVPLLISTAVLIYAERKIWAAVHIRRGPNVVGPWGVLQPFADFLKFLFKEVVIPDGANKGVFVLAPLVSVVLAISAWAVIPVNAGWVVADINVGILYLFAISSLGVYGIIMAGWASNSKYPFLSALRAAAQMVSYEVSIGFVIITVLLCAGSLNLSQIVLSQGTGLGTMLWSSTWNSRGMACSRLLSRGSCTALADSRARSTSSSTMSCPTVGSSGVKLTPPSPAMPWM